MTENHSQRAHALLSASGASRWMNCTPSPRIEESLKVEEQSSTYAAEGTLAHEFGDVELTRYLKKTRPKTYEARLAELRANELYTDEMEEYVAIYTDYVIQEFKAAKKKTKDAVLLIEEKVDLTDFIEEGFGTNDAMIIADGVLEVIDLKYGKGVKVDSKENSQLMLYGLGALNYYELSYDIHTVRLTIAQPRLNHIDSWDIEPDELMKWGEEVVRVKAAQAYAGEGETVAGDWCKWCKAKVRCARLSAKHLEVAQYEFKDPNLLTDGQLAHTFGMLSKLTDWVKEAKEYMLKEALAGRKFPGLKVVEGRSTRKFTSEEDVKTRLAENDFTMDQYTVTKMASLTAIEKLVGKKEFPVMLDGLVIKPQGSPTLVDESDKRPEYSSAAKDFED